MSQQDKDLQQEQQLLQHFRQHSQGEPSAAVDALILAAARQAIAPATPSVAQRLHGWLFGRGSRTRWSVAFAGLATLGIGLSLTWRTQEQAPTAYDRPAPVAAEAPAAPVLREMAPALEARKQLAEPEKKKAEMAESMAGSIEPTESHAAPAAAASMARQMPLAKPQAASPVEALSDAAVDASALSPAAESKAEAAANEQARAAIEGEGHSAIDEAPPLELRLHNVLRLRAEGRQDEADKLLQALRPEYPQLDLDAELKRLQDEALKPASSR
ncbi:hypothetical protein F3I62_17215 [Pseudomonas sp. R-28-1W-6]|uniref:hypothetical protein n=1 Tax=Pseudomonas sp. R-28-1W-6 TaxID=2650101 RepID=UPI001365EBC1|nr:hypothetical protein [Pseudomonas sp. R-28-1W-6]MWV13841.1 hypothetical protein [Pseudomonas sp. R-28-1W-6]